MSRGPGSVQRRIVEILNGAETIIDTFALTVSAALSPSCGCCRWLG